MKRIYITGLSSYAVSVSLAIVLAGCGESVSPGTNGPSLVDKTCQLQEAPSAGAVSPVPASDRADLCVRIPAGNDRYFFAFADVRSIERSRTGPAGSGKEPDFNMTVRGGKREIVVRTDFSTAAANHDVRNPPDAKLAQSDLQCPQNPDLPFCRTTPWRAGEKFKDGRGIVYSVFDIEGPLVIAVEQTKFDNINEDVKQTYLYVAKRLVATHLPLLQEVFGARSVTSPGSQQTLLVLGGIPESHAAIQSDGSTTRGYVEGGFSAEQADTFAIFFTLAHELTHLEQFHYAWELNPAARVSSNAQVLGYWGIPPWSSEGGADFLACESLRSEAGVPWSANLTLNFKSTSALKRYSGCLRDGSGSVDAGYASGAKYMRTLTEYLVANGASVTAARREVALGSLEGWFGIDDANLRFTGLTKRVATLSGSSFDPGISILETAMQTALDDVTPGSKWNITSTQAAWKYWGYHQAVMLSADTSPVDVFSTSDGSGYLVFDADTVARDVRINVPFTGMRWMIARQQR